MPEVTTPAAFGLGDIKELLSAFDGADVAELTVEYGDFRLSLKKPAPVLVAAAPALAAPAAVAMPVAQAPAPAAAAPAEPAPAAPAAASRGVTINAPMVGTFYSAPSPEAPAFVAVGDAVKPGQTVCIVEAMKLMNEIEAEVAGRVVRVLVQNGQPVEYGQPLIELEPA